MVVGLKARLPGNPALGLGGALAVGGSPEPLQPGKPEQPEENEEPGKPLELLFIAKIATPTMAAMIRPPTRSIAGLPVLLAGATPAVAGGIFQAGGTAAP